MCSWRLHIVFSSLNSATSLHSMLPVCEECRDKVLDCYRSNPGRTLHCSSEVHAYAECVEKARKVSDFSTVTLWHVIMTSFSMYTHRDYCKQHHQRQLVNDSSWLTFMDTFLSLLWCLYIMVQSLIIIIICILRKYEPSQSIILYLAL